MQISSPLASLPLAFLSCFFSTRGHSRKPSATATASPLHSGGFASRWSFCRHQSRERAALPSADGAQLLQPSAPGTYLNLPESCKPRGSSNNNSSTGVERTSSDSVGWRRRPPAAGVRPKRGTPGKKEGGGAGFVKEEVVIKGEVDRMAWRMKMVQGRGGMTQLE